MNDQELDDNQKIWRYMSFARFVYMFHKKELWFPRVDHLEDRWELGLSEETFARIVELEMARPNRDPQESNVTER